MFPIEKAAFPILFPKCPREIYFQGDIRLLEKLSHRGLAVVGTRRPQPRSEALVRRVLRDLRREDLIIISGLARGVDACAHKAALDVGLPTVAVLGCGLDFQYPEENEPLRKKILESGGLVLSEYASSVEAQPFFFIQRNRIIAGLSKATWIVQAPYRSGALNTAKWAREFGRDTYSTASFPGDPSFAGNEGLFHWDQRPHPLYHVSCLRETWREFNDLVPRRGGAFPKISTDTSDVIWDEVKCRSAQAGGVSVSDLLDWAVRCGFTPLDLYERLQKAQECGLVSEHQGILVAR